MNQASFVLELASQMFTLAIRELWLDDKEQHYETVGNWKQTHVSILADLKPFSQNILVFMCSVTPVGFGRALSGGLPAAPAAATSACHTA